MITLKLQKSSLKAYANIVKAMENYPSNNDPAEALHSAAKPLWKINTIPTGTESGSSSSGTNKKRGRPPKKRDQGEQTSLNSRNVHRHHNGNDGGDKSNNSVVAPNVSPKVYRTLKKAEPATDASYMNSHLPSFSTTQFVKPSKGSRKSLSGFVEISSYQDIAPKGPRKNSAGILSGNTPQSQMQSSFATTSSQKAPRPTKGHERALLPKQDAPDFTLGLYQPPIYRPPTAPSLPPAPPQLGVFSANANVPPLYPKRNVVGPNVSQPGYPLQPLPPGPVPAGPVLFNQIPIYGSVPVYQVSPEPNPMFHGYQKMSIPPNLETGPPPRHPRQSSNDTLPRDEQLAPVKKARGAVAKRAYRKSAIPPYDPNATLFQPPTYPQRPSNIPSKHYYPLPTGAHYSSDSLTESQSDPEDEDAWASDEGDGDESNKFHTKPTARRRNSDRNHVGDQLAREMYEAMNRSQNDTGNESDENASRYVFHHCILFKHNTCTYFDMFSSSSFFSLLDMSFNPILSILTIFFACFSLISFFRVFDFLVLCSILFALCGWKITF